MIDVLSKKWISCSVVKGELTSTLRRAFDMFMLSRVVLDVMCCQILLGLSGGRASDVCSFGNRGPPECLEDAFDSVLGTGVIAVIEIGTGVLSSIVDFGPGDESLSLTRRQSP